MAAGAEGMLVTVGSPPDLWSGRGLTPQVPTTILATHHRRDSFM